jgi:hypothetical protein
MERLKTPYFIDVFEDADKFCALHCSLASRRVPHASDVLGEAQHVVSLAARPCSIMQKHWFFCRAVVIRLWCSRSPRALDDIATHSG